MIIVVTDQPTMFQDNSPSGSYLAIRTLKSALESQHGVVVVYGIRSDGGLGIIEFTANHSVIQPRQVEDTLCGIVDKQRPEALVICVKRKSMPSLIEGEERQNWISWTGARHMPVHVVTASSLHERVRLWASTVGFERLYLYSRVGVARVSSHAKRSILNQLLQEKASHT